VDSKLSVIILIYQT